MSLIFISSRLNNMIKIGKSGIGPDPNSPPLLGIWPSQINNTITFFKNIKIYVLNSSKAKGVWKEFLGEAQC